MPSHFDLRSELRAFANRLATDRSYSGDIVDDLRALLTRTEADEAATDFRDAYVGAREDLLDWKGRALRAEAELRRLGCTGVCADEAATVDENERATQAAQLAHGPNSERAGDGLTVYYVVEVRGGDFDNIPISMFGVPALFTSNEAAWKFCEFSKGTGRPHEVRQWFVPKDTKSGPPSVRDEAATVGAVATCSHGYASPFECVVCQKPRSDDPVAWQCWTYHGGWEDCTKELHDQIVSTGRYSGPGSPLAKARELFTHPQDASAGEAWDSVARVEESIKEFMDADVMPEWVTIEYWMVLLAQARSAALPSPPKGDAE